MKNKTLILLLLFCITACTKSNKVVTHLEDYSRFLVYHQPVSNSAVTEELNFWTNRLEKNRDDETSLVKLAAIRAELFKSTGLVHHILVSDSLLKIVLKKYPQGNVEIFHTLSANAVAQHHFQAAQKYAEEALALRDKKAISLLLLADACLERGDVARTTQILRQFKNKNSFAYLIRKSKLQDHNGQLDSAIISMERAYDRIKGNKSLAQWTLTNLADMYGHAGRIQESYDTYLKVLENDAHDDHSLKGIAWIALSHDGKTSDAKAIVNALIARKRMPELHLMLSEIAALEKNENERILQLTTFKSQVSDPQYKTMYHKYLAQLEAEEFGNTDVAMAIANVEIQNRPTPQSYDLRAWAYYHEKKYSQALDIAQRQVEGQTFEPESIYHLGMIYKANGNEEKARQFLNDALNSKFELGPSKGKQIEDALQVL